MFLEVDVIRVSGSMDECGSMVKCELLRLVPRLQLAYNLGRYVIPNLVLRVILIRPLSPRALDTFALQCLLGLEHLLLHPERPSLLTLFAQLTGSDASFDRRPALQGLHPGSFQLL